MLRIAFGLFPLLFNLSLTPCRVPGVEEEVRCGRHEVYEDRAARNGRTIALNVVVLPAKGPKAAPDPLVFLAGGGVAPATRYAGYFSRAFPELRRERDIVLVDQRGTGGSNALQCELSTDPTRADYRNKERFVAAVRRCRAAVETKADLRFYTTPMAMDDLDDVRAWLGYPRINLYGASYGTSAAMAYVRQHGDHVRTVTLQGVVPLDVPMWLEVPRSSQQALEKVFAACAAQRQCHTAFPDLDREFASLLKRLAEKPVSVNTVTIDAEVLRDVVSHMLFGAERVHDLPLLIHLADQGDYGPLASKAASRGESEIPPGIYLSIVCSELIPQFDPAALPVAAAGTFMGSFRVERDITACREWVRGSLPPKFHAAVKSDVPALVMNGALDHLTPPSYGKHVAQTLPNARHVVLPERGHNDVDPCVNAIIEHFIAAGNSSDLDTSCLEKSSPLTFALKP
ncbi:MAG TPA: alpha/beta hydrolase [Thermoanaerobaculia bacterium]|nr:alpha/beta hydrolase [Thermoanaerobaculia bacterium]